MNFSLYLRFFLPLTAFVLFAGAAYGQELTSSVFIRVNNNNGEFIINPNVRVLDQDGKATPVNKLMEIIEEGFHKIYLSPGRYTLSTDNIHLDKFDFCAVPNINTIITINPISKQLDNQLIGKTLRLIDMSLKFVTKSGEQAYVLAYLNNTNPNDGELWLLSTNDPEADIPKMINLLCVVKGYNEVANRTAYDRQKSTFGQPDKLIKTVNKFPDKYNFGPPLLVKKIDESTAEVIDDIRTMPETNIPATLQTLINDLIAKSISKLYATQVKDRLVVVYSTIK